MDTSQPPREAFGGRPAILIRAQLHRSGVKVTSRQGCLPMRLPGYGTRGRVGLATGPAVPDMVHTRLLGSLEGGRCGLSWRTVWSFVSRPLVSYISWPECLGRATNMTPDVVKHTERSRHFACRAAGRSKQSDHLGLSDDGGAVSRSTIMLCSKQYGILPVGSEGDRVGESKHNPNKVVRFVAQI